MVGGHSPVAPKTASTSVSVTQLRSHRILPLVASLSSQGDIVIWGNPNHSATASADIETAEYSLQLPVFVSGSSSDASGNGVGTDGDGNLVLKESVFSEFTSILQEDSEDVEVRSSQQRPRPPSTQPHHPQLRALTMSGKLTSIPKILSSNPSTNSWLVGQQHGQNSGPLSFEVCFEAPLCNRLAVSGRNSAGCCARHSSLDLASQHSGMPPGGPQSCRTKYVMLTWAEWSSGPAALDLGESLRKFQQRRRLRQQEQDAAARPNQQEMEADTFQKHGMSSAGNVNTISASLVGVRLSLDQELALSGTPSGSETAPLCSEPYCGEVDHDHSHNYGYLSETLPASVYVDVFGRGTDDLAEQGSRRGAPKGQLIGFLPVEGPCR